jgi:hypothetical protein
MPDEIKSGNDYHRLLQSDKIPCVGTEDDNAGKRLEKILDIRKFEIELYWKRATYFWTFIAAFFGAYGITTTIKDADQLRVIKFQYLIICLGLIFTFAWYLANKASKYWQVNWETHLNLTEDKVFGPLYKTTISPKSYSGFWNPTKEYAASVSKINQILSLFVFFIWVALLADILISQRVVLFKNIDWYYTLIGLFSIAAFIYLLFGTKSSNKTETIVHFEIRKNKDYNDIK